MSQDNQTNEATDEKENGDVYAEREQGQKYGGSVYQDINYDSLEEAPETNEYPDSDGGSRFRLAEMPKVPKFSNILGPGAILLGAGIGSGEMMFWPTIIADNGWAVYWAFFVGIILKFFLITETQRWPIATGESIFQGLDRMWWSLPWIFLVLGFLNLGWPGWAATGSQIFASWTGVVPVDDWWIIGIIGIALIWLFYQIGPVLYNLVESIESILVISAVAIAIFLAFFLGTVGQMANLPASVIHFGTLPNNLDIATFLGAIAYAGSGSYVVLTQGVWAREKGYGMGTYQGRVKNPLRGSGEPEEVHSGFAFKPTVENLRRWKEWWKVTQLETFGLVVVGVVVLTTIATSIATAYVPAGTSVINNGVNMWLNIIIPQLGAVPQFLLYALLFIALFTTQFGVVEVIMRNGGDIIYEGIGRKRGWQISNISFGLLTIFSLWGIFVIGFQLSQPWYLLVIGAAIAGLTLWPHFALVIIMNTTRLPEHTQPGWIRTIAMWIGTGFFGYFSVILLGTQLADRLGLTTFETSISVMGSGIGGYVFWLIFLIVQIYTMYRSAQAKLAAKNTVDNASEGSGLLN
jgi:MFS family permease